MTDSATTPNPTLKSLAIIDQYGSLSQMLYQIGTELRSHYNKQLETEQDEAVRIRLLNDMNRASGMMDLGR